jgi:ubiquinone/menaquinone biosynthesis C-methylase UbiE
MNYNIFSDENIFITSSKVASNPRRLNYRCNLLLKSINLHGKNILDLGCHNGRWIYAALKLGSSHVTGIDNFSSYLKVAKNNLDKYPEYKNKFSLKEMDMLEYLKKTNEKYDIIFCFGVMYHTLNQYEILKECYRINPSMLIIDTTVFNYEINNNIINCNLKKNVENKEDFSLLYARKRNLDKKWELIPTEKMMEVWIKESGFSFKKMLNFNETIKEEDYISGSRITYHCVKDKMQYA